jgi:hypothetical protein
MEYMTYGSFMHLEKIWNLLSNPLKITKALMGWYYIHLHIELMQTLLLID